MKFGVFLNSQHPQDDDPGRRFAEIVEQVRLIKKVGFDSIWGGEHHVTPGYHYFPLMPMLIRLAPEADGLAMGTNIMLLPLHNPVEAAEIGAFLDVITGGKFVLGVGLGYREEEFAVFGVPMKERVSRMSEGIEIIRRLWSEDVVTHRGRHWQLENVAIRPRPAQRPRPPILIAAQVDASIKRAAEISDGWCIVPVPRTDQIRKETALFKSARQAAGLPPSQHLVRLYEVACASDEETALRQAAPFLLTKYASYASWGLPGLKFDKGAAPEEQLRSLAADRFAVGSPEQVAAGLLKQHELGMTEVGMRISWPGMKQDDILATIELIGRKVLPEVRKKIAAAA
jgi:alkanesulfonate monooxygenase SsuD/methylene tetrahydromethanopterin reductase-like flavin-dependent oxidoreductase (luciferase family)